MPSKTLQPGKTYPPVGSCIYCGATRYSIDRNKLAEEHIVPYCVGGDHILPEASCKKCEGLTGGLEQQLFGERGLYRTARSALSMRSRRGKPADVYQTVPLHVTIGGQDVRLNLRREDAPHFIVGVDIKRAPGLLVGRPDEYPGVELEISQVNANAQPPTAPFGPPPVTASNVLRLPAKIAHALATAEFGLGNFQPTLLDYIKTKRPNNVPWGLIGGLPAGEPADGDFELALHLARARNLPQYIVVEIRLFARLRFPRYLVIAGII